MKGSIRALLVAAATAWAALAPSGAHASNPSLQRDALRLSDLPAGFRQTRAALVSNAQVANRDHLSLALLEQHGRIASYETAFIRPVPFGLVTVEDSVAAYRTAGGAIWDYSAWAASMRKTAGQMPGSMRAVLGGSLGSERVAYTVKDATDGVPLTDYLVLFRRGSSWVLLLAAGRTGTVSEQAAFRLAAVIDNRLAAAGR